MPPEAFPYDLVDLTHTLHEQAPSWDGTCGFEKRTILDYDECQEETKFRVHTFTMQAGIGTHLDAPAHCIPGGNDVAQLPLSALIAPCILIDVSSRASSEHFILGTADITKFENQYGVIPAGALVIVRTGWDRHWNSPENYHNNHQFPSVALEAAQTLIKRGIIGFGLDTLSCDCPQSGFISHQAFLSSGIYLVENVAHADRIPPVGAFVAALPLKIAGATESPIRLIGMIPRKEITKSQ